MRETVDLTHPMLPGMPVYPGTEPPTFQSANTVDRDGFAEKLISMYSHTGTHIDAPAHMLAGGLTLDRCDVQRFVGQACVIDVSTPGTPVIEAAALEPAADLVAGCQFVLFHTGWSALWGQDAYFTGFPVLAPDAVRWLVARQLSGVGFDAISADPVGQRVFRNHLEFFRAEMLIVENLTNLRPLIGTRFLFACLPLKLQDADGSPIRAVAMVQ